MRILAASAVALCALSTGHVAATGAADATAISGAWQIRGSVFFNEVVTICHFRSDSPDIAATCESDGKLGDFMPATITGSAVAWKWNAGPAVLTFQGHLTSATVMKGEIKVRGFTGDFTATKR